MHTGWASNSFIIGVVAAGAWKGHGFALQGDKRDRFRGHRKMVRVVEGYTLPIDVGDGVAGMFGLANDNGRLRGAAGKKHGQSKEMLHTSLT